jgi:hypothetical protein
VRHLPNRLTRIEGSAQEFVFRVALAGGAPTPRAAKPHAGVNLGQGEPPQHVSAAVAVAQPLKEVRRPIFALEVSCGAVQRARGRTAFAE